jgi:hypothetical protein
MVVALLPVVFTAFRNDPDLNNMALRCDICFVNDGDSAAVPTVGVVVVVAVLGDTVLETWR